MVALLDGHMLDWLADRPHELRMVRLALEEGRLRLIQTHILRDELDRTTDAEKWARLEAVRGVLVGEEKATAGMVLDVSALDAARLFAWDEVERFAALSVDNPAHAEDALLALTAEAEGAVLVTNDVRAGKRAARQGIDVVDAVAFM